MVKFADVPLDAGNAARVADELNAAIAESGKTRQGVVDPITTQAPKQLERAEDVDPRFSGKSTSDIVNMYKNLESHSGRLANQLGETKQALNQLILTKRDSDIRQQGVEPVKINPTDLMVNPTEAIDRLLAGRESPQISALQKRLNELEAQLGQTTFVTRHPNAQDDTVDPAFQAWVQQTPLRQKLNADAAAGNFYAADALLTEWTQSKPKSTVTSAVSRAQELANRTSLESNNAGGDAGDGTRKSGRTFKRADLIALRQTNPELYESDSYQKEIVKAYREGRVVD